MGNNSNTIELDELNKLIEEMYVPEQDLLNQLPKEILMFIHFRTVGRANMGDRVDSCTLTAFKEILKTNKKISSDQQTIIKELFTYLSCSDSQILKPLNISNLFNTEYCSKTPYYKCLNEVCDDLWGDIYRQVEVSLDEINQLDIIKKIKERLTPKQYTYNSVILISLYGNIVSISNSSEFHCNNSRILQYILVNLYSCRSEIHRNHMNTLIKTNTALRDAKREIERRDIEITNYKNLLKEATKDKKYFEKQVEINNQRLNKYFDSILNQSSINIDKVITEIKNMEKEVIENVKKEFSDNTYKSIIDHLNEKISDLKSALKTKSKDYNILSIEYRTLINKPIIQTIKEYIKENGPTKDLLNIINLYSPYKADQISNEVKNKKEVEDCKEDPIGYCIIVDNKHYVKFPNGQTFEILDLPEGTYLTEGQVVLVSSKGEFKFAFQYTCLGIGLHPLVELAVVTVVSDNQYQVGINRKLKELKSVPKDIRLKNMQVIVIDKDGNYVRGLRRVSLNADSLIPSMRIKGHIPYFVLKVISKNKFVLRKIDSEMEKDKFILKQINDEIEVEKEITYTNTDIKRYSVIGLNKYNEIVSYFPTGKFYTLSSYYKKSKYGIIEYVDNIPYAKIIEDKQLIKILEIPGNITLEDGKVVKIDEFGNLLEVVNDQNSHIKREVIPIKHYDGENKERYANQEIKKNISILGNLSYSVSYKLAFLKKGYNAEIVDGFDTWKKVYREIKDKDLVILTIGFVSHENMFEIKKTDIPTMFSEFDGANMLIKQVEEYYG